MIILKHSVNFIINIIGGVYLAKFGMYIFGYYQPNKFSIAINMLAIGTIFLLLKYTPKDKKEKLND